MSTIAARMASGKLWKKLVKNTSTRAMTADATASDKGVRAPAFSLTALCDNPPATRKPCHRPAKRLAAPKPRNSCRGFTV
jgi:hypothetical protein